MFGARASARIRHAQADGKSIHCSSGCFRNVSDLIALAKSAPEKLTMASAGVGNLTHLAGELFMSMTGTRFVHVPYKGAGQVITDLLGGQVSLYFSLP